MIETGISQLLLQSPNVTAIIGTNIYPVTLPEDFPIANLPAVTYQVVSASPDFNLDLTMIGEKRLQVDVWSTRYLDGLNAQAAIQNALAGAINTVLPDNATILLNALPGVELDDFESSNRTYRRMVEYDLQYTATTE